MSNEYCQVPEPRLCQLEQAERDIAVLRTARPIAEYHEDMGPVLWWKFPIEEPPYVGGPNDLGFTVESEMVMWRPGEPEVTKLIREEVGGWPGYHTHFTPIPKVSQP